jgi:phosphopantothenoylcysteine decarboxylase/phosphopantothenate--cysteine ligase
MHCVVTAGPTFESLDQVRRLTNFSTGRLGVGLAGFLADRGHPVTLLLSEQALVRPASKAIPVVPITTTTSLRQALMDASRSRVDVVFHAAAVCDFTFGQVWRRSPDGQLLPAGGGKISTREGTLLAELRPTPKLIAELRSWFPDACLVGWKYEVDGDRNAALQAGIDQLVQHRTSACVVNGPAYGDGFGLVCSGGHKQYLQDAAALFPALLQLITS